MFRFYYKNLILELFCWCYLLRLLFAPIIFSLSQLASNVHLIILSVRLNYILICTLHSGLWTLDTFNGVVISNWAPNFQINTFCFLSPNVLCVSLWIFFIYIFFSNVNGKSLAVAVDLCLSDYYLLFIIIILLFAISFVVESHFHPVCI